MNKRIYKGLAYFMSMLLGGGLVLAISEKPKSIKKTFKQNYVYRGKCNDKIPFTINKYGLFNSDSTVLGIRKGILNTPKLAGEVFVLILEDKYPKFAVKNNYPFGIYKGIYSWHIFGTCLYVQEKYENSFFFGDVYEGFIQRSDGMVITYACWR